MPDYQTWLTPPVAPASYHSSACLLRDRIIRSRRRLLGSLLSSIFEFDRSMTPYQVNVAAEAFVAAVMSQAGYDVAMQYGTTQPDWDILATKGARTLKLQVKGSQDGGWGLFQSYIKNADYHGALEAWSAAQITDIVYVLVQFANVPVGAAPRCYVARPKEILEHMRTTRGGHAYTSLRENYSYTKGLGAGHTDIVPPSWLLSQERIDAV